MRKAGQTERVYVGVYKNEKDLNKTYNRGLDKMDLRTKFSLVGEFTTRGHCFKRKDGPFKTEMN